MYKTLLLFTVSFMLFGCSTTNVKLDIKPGDAVLPYIEKYKAPENKYSFESIVFGRVYTEPYDSRIKHGTCVPPTLTDVLICDIWMFVTKILRIKIETTGVTKDAVKKAIKIYMTNDWKHVIGYRPWTHLHFIHSLTDVQQDQLSEEIKDYIIKYGVKECKE
jgi:hypothetical protein